MHEPSSSVRPGGSAAEGTSVPCDTIIVLGASARAIAHSARRAGLRVFAADLFGDRDLEEVCDGYRVVRQYPGGLEAAAREFPPAPWIYCGGIEHHVELIESITRLRPLAGCPPEAVRAVRDPIWLATVSRAGGLKHPETTGDPAGLPLDGSFLVKPRRGAGGRGIAPWTACQATIARDPAEWLWQRRIDGTPRSVALVVGAAETSLVGTSRQLVGLPASRGPAFGWCGGIEVQDVATSGFLKLSRRLADVGCRGLVGIDFIEDAHGDCHVLEVNPRPTASMELFERTLGTSLVAAHLEACGFAPPLGSMPPPAGPSKRPSRPTWAKGWLFADGDVVVTADVIRAWEHLDREWRTTDGPWPAFADLPRPDTVVPARGPIVSVFARGRDQAEAGSLLETRLLAANRAITDPIGAGPSATP